MVFIITALVLLISAYRIRWGLLFFAFVLPFSPRALAIPIGSEGLALTGQRLWMACFLIYFVFALMQNKLLRLRIRNMLSKQASFVRVLSALLILKLASTVFFAEWRDLLYFFDDLLFSALAFTIYYAYFRTRAQFVSLIFFVVLGVLLSGLLVPLEWVASKPVLSHVVESRVYGADVALAGRERAGAYRVQALFDNPLSLTEFVVLALPLAIYFISAGRGRKRLIGVVSLGLVPMILLGTGARSGWLVSAVSIGILFLAFYWPRLSTGLRFFVGTIIAIGVLASLMQAIPVIYAYGEMRDGENLWQYDSSERSSIERASQYFIVTKEVFSGNYLGFGVRQNFTNELKFLNNLDNYWLRLMLEGGILALFLFMMIIYVLFSRTLRFLNETGRRREDRYLCAAMIAFLTAFALMKFFLSMPSNNIYLYLIFGAFLGFVDVARKVNANAHFTRSQ